MHTFAMQSRTQIRQTLAFGYDEYCLPDINAVPTCKEMNDLQQFQFMTTRGINTHMHEHT